MHYDRFRTQNQPRVLVVDDEPIIAKLIERSLFDCLVVTAERAWHALERIRRGEWFDVVLCDLMMPGMDGSVFYKHLTRDAPDQAKRVIFLTGGGATEAARAFLASVPQPVMTKPFKVAALRMNVATFVESAAAAY